MRLPRPHVPLAVRVKVAERQFIEKFNSQPIRFWQADGKHLAVLLAALFPVGKFELHHRPALTNRRRYIRKGKTFYDPPANSADHLFYLLKPDHDVETRVRGLYGQHSDLALARKRRRKERKAKRKRLHRWPPSRKLQSRKFNRRNK